MVTQNNGTAIEQNGKNRASPEPNWTTRQVVIATLVVVLVVFGFWLIVRFRVVVFGLFVAIVFSTAIRPPVDWLEQRGLPRAFGSALVFFLVLALLTGLLMLLLPLLTTQGSSILNTLLTYYDDLRQYLVSTPSILIQRLAQRLPITLQPFRPPIPVNPNEPLDQVALAIGYGTLALRGVFTALSVLLLTFYWTVDRNRILMSTLMLLPATRRPGARAFYDAIEEKVGAYLRGLGILTAAIGVLSLIAYLIIGVPYAAVLAVLAGLMEAVPLIGPVLGAIPAVLVAMALDPSKVIWIIVATILVQQLENNLLVPRVMDQSVGVNPVVSLLALIIFGSLFGLAGALMAIPLAAVLQLLFNRAFLDPSPASQQPAGRDSVSLLRYEAQELIQDVRKQVREKDTSLLNDPSDQVEDAIEAIVNDLDSILAQAEEQTPAEAQP